MTLKLVSKQNAAASVLLCALVSGQTVRAEEALQPFVGVAAGTTGLGLQAGLQLRKNLSIRVLTGDLSLDETRAVDEVDYTIDADIKMPQLLVDYHPFGSGFFFSGGFIRNGTSVKGLATLSEPTQIGSTTINPEDVGGLQALVEYDEIVPYVGIGWSTGMGGERAGALSWQFEFGVSSMSSSSVALSELDSGNISEADLDEEARNIQTELDDELSFYLNLRMGVQYHF